MQTIEEYKIILHQGIYKKPATIGEAVFLITGMTIGAGVLGIPYVVVQVGLAIGVAYILALGFIMLLLNFMIGQVASNTKQPLQLPGLAGRYVGGWAKYLLSVVLILSAYGALLAYVVGEGKTLAALFGGNPVLWSVVFWSVGSVIVWRGLQTAKNVDKILSLLVIAIITGLSLFLLPRFHADVWNNGDWSKILMPFGVILFALHASPAVIEAHALLPDRRRDFQKALVIGTLIPIAVYVLFAIAVVGVLGLETSEIATIALGERFGSGVLLAGNLFAAMSMGTGFIGLGIALKQTLVWDHKVPTIAAELAVIAVPLTLFLLGVRSFVRILDVVGGLFIGIEALLMVLVCWRARRLGDLASSTQTRTRFWLAASPVLLVFISVVILSIIKLF